MPGPQTKAECFDFSCKNQYRFDDYYKAMGAQVIRITGKRNKDYDAIVLWNGHRFTVEEKVLSEEYDHLAVEILQDIDSNDSGWIEYSKADYLFWITPLHGWFVKMNMLRKYILYFGDRCSEFISTKGWGRTLNKRVGWDVIVENKIGKQLW